MFHPRLTRLLALLSVLLLCAAALLLGRHRRNATGRQLSGHASLISPELFAAFNSLEEQERRLDETAWAPERRAEECGQAINELWDAINQASNRFDVLAAFPVSELVLSRYGPPERVIDDIEVMHPADAQVVWLQQDWQHFLNGAQQQGWQLSHIEFRQRGFEPGNSASGERSLFSFRADAEKTNGLERATIEGNLLVSWVTNAQAYPPLIRKIDARRVSIRTRKGESPFKPVLVETVVPPEKWLFIDPLILYDLDGDGRSEIILAGKNLVYHRQPNGEYQQSQLCRYDPGRIFTAVVADFDGDGFADLVCAKPEGLFLFHGSNQGTFDEPPRLVWPASPPLKYGQLLTCGDVNHDGNLDLFLGQYKSPYFHGQMPTPYCDANDGDPAYLLINDGNGNFSDATEQAGLGAKRHRRIYSASFAYLPGGDNADLVVVSDFAGIDAYRNDGHGHFKDVTATLIPDALGFGMAHTLADFNRDGRLDLLMIGMDSPAVDRLESLKLWRSDAREPRNVRARLASGNKLLLARPNGFEQTEFSRSIGRSGWSWGCAACDFDNDGFPEVYIANGHESRATVRDYEPEFWLHDIYVAGSTNDRVADLYFQSKFTGTRARGYSYGGYEENRLYLNLAGTSFLEAGHLLGVGLEQDCRNVVADDLDGDGKMDLLVTTFEVWPVPKQTLRVYQNRATNTGNWIGFRFREQGRGKSPVGASITIHYDQYSATAQLVTGDSYRCQSANVLHFGLGTQTKVDSAEVVWQNGTKTRIESPAINQYFTVRFPE